MASTIRADRRATLADLRGQGFRFVLTGGVVALVYVATTTILSQLVGVGFELSLAIGFAVAIATHFSLQRMFVWRHAAAFALRFHHQLGRYLVLAAIQYALTAAITATLPRALGVSPELVYLPTVAILSAMNFVIFRSRIFHAELDRRALAGGQVGE
jgi:putative flippase GtrA